MPKKSVVLRFDYAMGRRPAEQKQSFRQNPALLAERLSRGRWVRAPHLDLTAERIAQIRHRPIKIMVFMPPRHGKSELLSHYTPVWFLSEFPWKRTILASYEMSFAATWGGKAKNTIENSLDDLGITLTRDTKAKSAWNIVSFGGGMVCAGVGGPITGKGADLLIIDDPVKNAEEALSEVYREKAYNWYQSVAFTRLEPGASMILIMTRWHEDDLAGRILREEPGEWEVISLPAIAEGPDLLQRKAGTALWPRRFPMRRLIGPLKGDRKPIREVVGPYWWASLYQQRPKIEGGNIIKLDWWLYLDDIPICQDIVQAWDTAFEETERNNYSVCTTMGRFDRGFVVLDVWRGRLEFPELKIRAKIQADLWKPRVIVVEDKASGRPLVQTLKRETKLPILSVPSTGTKEIRAHSITGLLEAGRVYVLRGTRWLPEFLDELSAFPTGTYDDQVDSFVYALLQLNPFHDPMRDMLKGKKKKSRWRSS